MSSIPLMAAISFFGDFGATVQPLGMTRAKWCVPRRMLLGIFGQEGRHYEVTAVYALLYLCVGHSVHRTLQGTELQTFLS